MAVVLGTSSGFVTVAPTADPAGTGVTIDGSSVVTKDTSPANAVKITEIGWYRGSGTNTANFEVALYADSAGVATTRLFVDATNSSSSGGWITTAVDWTISPSTAYWLGLQMDAHGGSSSVDSETSGGAGSDVLTSQTTLADPYGGGAVADADGMYAIYALVQTTPTTTLSTADATNFGADSTPTLEFTGTDANADSVRYEVQIDTVNTFDSQTAAVEDSYSETNNVGGSDVFMSSANDTGNAQSFISTGGRLHSAKWFLKKSTGATGNAFAKLYASTGTHGTDAKPTGSPLATSDAFDVSTLTTSYALTTFNFSGANRVEMTDGTVYCITIEYTGSATTIQAGYDNTSPSHGGNRAYEFPDGTWNPLSTYDLCFYVYKCVPLLDKVSGTDSGFVNTTDGGDTDPFDSGDLASFTVQGGDALADGTYHWRARAKDPTGTTFYGAWASSRSFIIDSSAPSTAIKDFISMGFIAFPR